MTTKSYLFFSFHVARNFLNDGQRRRTFAAYCAAGEPIWRTGEGLWTGEKPTPDAELDNSERFPTENLDAENLRRLKLYLYNNYLSWGVEEVTAYAENRKREEEADALNERKGACSYGN